MKLSKIFVFIFSIIILSSIGQLKTSAATLPIQGVPVFIKSLTTGQILSSTTDTSGAFVFNGTETSGSYNLFVNDETMPPIKIDAKNGVLKGRVVILTDGTTTQDPKQKIAPKITKKIIAPVKKIVSATSTKKSE